MAGGESSSDPAFTRGPITLVAAGAAVRQREGTSTQPGRFGGSRSATSSSAFTPDLQLSFRNGLAFTASLSTRSQRTENNGNATLLDQDDITGSLNYAFALPAALSRTRKRVRSTLTAISSKTVTCLEQGFNPECTVVSDVRRQEFRGGLDTDLLKTVTGGLQFGYSINDARHLSRRTSQISCCFRPIVALRRGLQVGRRGRLERTGDHVPRLRFAT